MPVYVRNRTLKAPTHRTLRGTMALSAEICCSGFLGFLVMIVGCCCWCAFQDKEMEVQKKEEEKKALQERIRIMEAKEEEREDLRRREEEEAARAEVDAEQRRKEEEAKAEEIRDGGVKDFQQAARKLQTAWRQTAVKLEEKKAKKYKEARAKILRRKLAVQCIQRAWRAEVPFWRLRPRRTAATETLYDAVLAFESLSNFLTTGEIEFLQAAESKFDFAKESHYRIVAVVGLFDKGKTWLTNKLFKKNLPSGKLCSTRGISFLWIEKLQMLVLDSAGVRRPVSHCEGAVQSIQDARSTESLMFEMISRIADYMIFVVNDFTWFEQEYASMLHRKYVQSHQHKELIVVHNLRMTSEPAEAEHLFHQQIKKCYKGGFSPLDELTYVAEPKEGDPVVHHVALCKEMTLAGEKYNEKNISHLKNQLRFRHMLGRSVSLTDCLRKELERLIPTFAYVELAPEKMPDSEKTLSVLYETCNEADKEMGFSNTSRSEKKTSKDYGKVGSMRLKAIHPDAKVSMKTQGVINPLGEIIAHDVTFEPNVNVYDRRLQDGIERVIRIECPGVQQEDIDWEELANGVKISIRKQKPIEETAVHPVEPIMQHHGPWERAFEFENGSGRFDFSEEDFILADGVLTVNLRKSFQCRRGKVGRNPTLLQAGLQGGRNEPTTPSVKSNTSAGYDFAGEELAKADRADPAFHLTGWQISLDLLGIGSSEAVGFFFVHNDSASARSRLRRFEEVTSIGCARSPCHGKNLADDLFRLFETSDVAYCLPEPRHCISPSFKDKIIGAELGSTTRNYIASVFVALMGHLFGAAFVKVHVLVLILQHWFVLNASSVSHCDEAASIQLQANTGVEVIGECSNSSDTDAINAGQCNFDGACTSCEPSQGQPIPFASDETGFPNGVLNCSGNSVCQVADPMLLPSFFYNFKNSNDYISCAGTRACRDWRVRNLAAACCLDGNANCEIARFSLVEGNPSCSQDICCKGSNVCTSAEVISASSVSCRGSSVCFRARMTLKKDLFCEGESMGSACSEAILQFGGGSGSHCIRCLGNGNSTCSSSFFVYPSATACMRCETQACDTAQLLLQNGANLYLHCGEGSCNNLTILALPASTVTCSCSGPGCSNIDTSLANSVSCPVVDEAIQPCSSCPATGEATAFCDKGPNADPDCSACHQGGGGLLGTPTSLHWMAGITLCCNRAVFYFGGSQAWMLKW
eukprot:s1312_g9.t1